MNKHTPGRQDKSLVRSYLDNKFPNAHIRLHFSERAFGLPSVWMYGISVQCGVGFGCSWNELSTEDCDAIAAAKGQA